MWNKKSPIPLDTFFADIIDRAIESLRLGGTSIYTFALYHDHESRAVEVLADTSTNSASVVTSSNAFNRTYFGQAIKEGDLKDAATWKTNYGRNFSLGDFAIRGIARTDLAAAIRTDNSFYLAMIRAVIAREKDIATLAEHPDQLMFCCSGKRDEVAYVWTVE